MVIPNKSRAVECSKRRTIRIMSHMAKIVLKNLYEKLKGKVEETVDKAQFGFRKGMETRNATFTLRTIMKRAVEKRKDIFSVFR